MKMQAISLSLTEGAELVGCTYQTILNYIKDGRLTPIRTQSTKIRVSPKELLAIDFSDKSLMQLGTNKNTIKKQTAESIPPPHFYNIPRASKILGCTEQTLRRYYLKKNFFKFGYFAHQTWVDGIDLDSYIPSERSKRLVGSHGATKTPM